MKTVDIVTRDMHQLHGANKVTEILIRGRDIFESRGIDLRYVVSRDGILDCRKYGESTLGRYTQTDSYARQRRAIDLLKKNPLYRSRLIQGMLVDKEINDNSAVVEALTGVHPKPDAVIFQDPFAAIHCLRHGFEPEKSIFISHADSDPLEQLLLGRSSLQGTKKEAVLRADMDFLYHRVDSVVTICNSARKYVVDHFGFQPYCIINGIEDADRKAVRKLSEDDGNIHVAIVASLQYRKGQDIAIDALSALDNGRVILHLVGDGATRDALTATVRERGLEAQVVFHGIVFQVDALLPQMDAFMLPTRADTVPIAIIEALRAGLPVFASPVGEIPFLIAGCGELVDPSVDAVKEIYQRLLYGEIDLVALGKRARARYLAEFHISRMIERYAGVILDLFEDKPGKV